MSSSEKSFIFSEDENKMDYINKEVKHYIKDYVLSPYYDKFRLKRYEKYKILIDLMFVVSCFLIISTLILYLFVSFYKISFNDFW